MNALFLLGPQVTDGKFQVVGLIWPMPGSRAYCSGCFAPGSRLVGHTTGVQTGVSGPHLWSAANFSCAPGCVRVTHPERGGRLDQDR
jgi:hypothetical protein